MSPGWGFEAIAVALIARLNPIGIVVAALLFGALDNGSQAMQRAQGVSAELVQVIQALVIMILLAFDTPIVAQLWSALGRSKVAAPRAVSELPNA
jgi:simple sugar transport system permease protein